MQEIKLEETTSEVTDSMAKQEPSKEARLNQYYPRIRAKLEMLSAEQLNMYLHEVEWLLKQFEEIVPGPLSPNLGIGEHSSQIEAQVTVIQDALILERARRQFLSLQALIVGSDSADGSQEAL